jgi:hypothetical protein
MTMHSKHKHEFKKYDFHGTGHGNYLNKGRYPMEQIDLYSILDGFVLLGVYWLMLITKSDALFVLGTVAAVSTFIRNWYGKPLNSMALELVRKFLSWIKHVKSKPK